MTEITENTNSVQEEVAEKTACTDDAENLDSVNQCLNRLEQWCSQESFTSGVPIPTEGLELPLQIAIKQVLKILGVDEIKVPCFIKANYNRSGYLGLKFPEVALIKGEAHFIFPHAFIPAQPFLTDTKNKKYYSYEMGTTKNKAGDDIYYYSLKIVDMEEDSDTSDLMFRVWMQEDLNRSSLPVMQLKKSYDFAKKSMAEYIFPYNTIPKGTFKILETKKSEKAVSVKLENNFWYYVKDLMYDQIMSVKNTTPKIICEGWTEFDAEDEETKEKQHVKFYKFFVEGFGGSTKIIDVYKKYVEHYNLSHKDKPLVFDSEKDFNLTVPVEVDYVGLVESKQKNIPFFFQVKIGDEILTVKPNTEIKRKYAKGMFKLKTTEGVKLTIRGGNRTVENNQVKWEMFTGWIIPEEATNSNDGYKNLREKMKQYAA